MLDTKFVWLLITFVWMSGLFAILLTVAHIVQDRRKHWQEPGYVWGMPRSLLPLYGSLALFCLGLAMQAYAAQRPLSLWIMLVWALLAASFLGRALRVLLLGLQHGWNVRLNSQLINLDSADFDPGMRIPVWLAFTALLLLINLYFLTTLGIAQVNAGPLAQRLLGVVQEESSSSAPLLNSNRESVTEVDSSTESIPNSTDESDPTPTVSVEPTVESQPASSMTDVAVEVEPTPTPMPTEMPTAIPTAMPTVAPENIPSLTTQTITISVVVQSPRGANVREAPSLTADIVTVVDDATVLPVLGRTSDNQWFSVQLEDGGTGWISIRVVKPSKVIDLAPIIAEQ